MKRVEVTWGDAWIETDDISVAKAKKLKPVVRSTVGYLVAKNKHAYVLVTDVYADDKKTVNTPMVIPLGMVIEYAEL